MIGLKDMGCPKDCPFRASNLLKDSWLGKELGQEDKDCCWHETWRDGVCKRRAEFIKKLVRQQTKVKCLSCGFEGKIEEFEK